jgi:hypothetical protein
VCYSEQLLTIRRVQLLCAIRNSYSRFVVSSCCVLFGTATHDSSCPAAVCYSEQLLTIRRVHRKRKHLPTYSLHCCHMDGVHNSVTRRFYTHPAACSVWEVGGCKRDGSRGQQQHDSTRRYIVDIHTYLRERITIQILFCTPLILGT